jgi:hypothetical protein
MDTVTESEMSTATLEVLSDADHKVVIMQDGDGCCHVWAPEFARSLGMALIRRADMAEGLPPRATLTLIPKTA